MFGRFEADRPNARWVGDALHAPQVEGRKAILIDDHSRAIVAARWGHAENAVALRQTLKLALAARGRPAQIYVDNGACFIDAGLRRAPAVLGIKLTHSQPDKPAGRGQIEGPSRRNAAGECRCEGRFRYGCGVLQALEVSHSFGERVVLDEVTLRVRPGVLTGLLGPNGAGKTTLLRLLLGVIEADAGRFVLNGAPVTAAERQRWGYMPQERGLYPAMAAGAQVVYFGRLHGLSDADATRRARDLLAEVGLSDRWGERTDRLSGGQQQRLQLATSLVHDPQIIVLDEPFAGLDPVAVADLSHTLTDRVRHGRTVLLSSHQLDLVQELCEEIVMIDRGRTVLEGAVADLRSSSGSRQLRLVLVPPQRAWLSGLPGVSVVQAAADELRLALARISTQPVDRKLGGRFLYGARGW